MATVTREELPELIREEMLNALRNIPAVRYQVIGIMTEVFAQRADLQAILERIDAQRADFNQRMEEFAARQEEHSRRLDEMREDFNRRMDEMREDFNRGFIQLSKEIRDVDLHVQAMGARWGILAEDAFRAGIAGILTEETGLKVERYLKMDTKGQVFGQPDQVEIDVVIHNGDYWLLEVKSSISRGDVSIFQRKVAFYEQEEKVKVRRSIIISPYFDPGAQEQARALGMETYTSAREVRV